jgi:very-short-patch-repair endonuclease
MDNLNWPTLFIIFLGLVLMLAVYRFIQKSKAGRPPDGTTGQPVRPASKPQRDTRPAFEQAYQRKLEEIKKRRQQREQTRRMATERARQSAQLRSRSTEQQQATTALSAGTAASPSSKIIGTGNKFHSASKQTQTPQQDGINLQKHAENGNVSLEKSLHRADLSIFQRKDERKDEDPIYSLGWQQARQVAAETVSENQDIPAPDALVASDLTGATTNPQGPAVTRSSEVLMENSPFSPPLLSAAQSELLNDYARYFVLCDSKPQLVLLKALINQAHLKPDGDVLSGAIRVQPQSKVLSQRVDFLVNEKLAVDIDRHVYRNTKMTVIRDRMRNQSLILDGYRPITFSGNQILADPNGIAQTIIATALRLKQ